MEISLKEASGGKTSSREGNFIPQETPDQPFDITLVVEDGKEFKAHRSVLSEASSFFEKLLNSDMRESNEGVVRLEMVPGHLVRDILEFIYTGSVQTLVDDNSQELYELADYLVVPHLKTLAGYRVVQKKLNASNAISSFHFAETYRLEELIFRSKTFIVANFSSVAKTEDFLNLSSKEILKWISQDEIHVTAEENVFQIILSWVECDKSERKKSFPELFREVRLVYVSRDYLQSDVVTNELVNNNEHCLNLVRDAIEFIDSKKNRNFYVKPRESYSESTPVIVTRLRGVLPSDDFFVCYFPREEKWTKFPAEEHVPPTEHVVSCHGTIYFICQPEGKQYCYDSFFNSWLTLPFKEQRKLQNVFVRDDNEIYALVSTSLDSCSECITLRSAGEDLNCCQRKHSSFITKYKPESNSWVDVTSINFCDMSLREGVCIVVKDNFIYFLGGSRKDCRPEEKALKDVDRYDLTTNTWEKMSDLQQARIGAYGAVVNEKLFIAGGWLNQSRLVESCEVYLEDTSEWNFVQGWIPRGHFGLSKYRDPLDYSFVCADGMLYLVMLGRDDSLSIECYDPEKNEWYEKAQKEFKRLLKGKGGLGFIPYGCSVKVFKSSELYQKAFKFTAGKHDKGNCSVM